jgi:RecA/RadA recombinase
MANPDTDKKPVVADAKKRQKAMERLLSLEGAVTERANIHDDVICSQSPSLNFIFGKGQGLPAGYTMLLYGPPRGGKSIICNDMAGMVHKTDPDAVVAKFNTEFRETAQLDVEQMRMYGIDPNRLASYEVNAPDQIFDRIEKQLAAEIQDGLKVKLVIIDSLSGIQGRRGMNSDTIMTQQIGDKAATIQDGMARILPIQRKYKFALIVTAHIRAQIEMTGKASSVVNTSRTAAVRPQASFATQHHCEYYVYVQPATGDDARSDILGNKYEDTDLKDMEDNSELTGHRVRVRMMDSSFGPKKRAGAFTFDYNRGIINTHEEVFLLGLARNIIEKPNQQTYSCGGKEWRGKAAILSALKNDPELQLTVIKELRRRDLAGAFDAQDKAEEASIVESDGVA